MVMTRAQYAEVADTEIAARQPPPLVVDVVSTNWRDDYVTKLSEYERTGIPEYWIVDYAALAARAYTGDPKQPVVSVGTLTEGRYTVERYRGEMAIASPTFPNLTLTVNQIVASTEI
ncbi:MAG: Uma2 family endonuclease [Spirulinaceae cyanobacterium RM2_2_10]|nr:Uma2 family endonuclease [Spirulinaceae cyanobacterium RM2_2_10]